MGVFLDARKQTSPLSELDSIPILASFLLSFKSVLIEGSEVTILSLATLNLIGRRNVFLGIVLGSIGALISYVILSQVFLFVAGQSEILGLANGGLILIDLIAGSITLFFSWRFLKEFVKYYRTRSSFEEAMAEETAEVVEQGKKARASGPEPIKGQQQEEIPFSLRMSLPVLTITLSEGFEASLVIAAASTFNPTFATVGAVTSILLLLVIAAVAYRYLTRVPKWALEGLAGAILLVFGSYFIILAALLYL
jgi:uncharacterized membrane protein